MGFNASLAFGAYLVFAAVFLFVIMFGESEMFQGTIVERIHYWTTEGWCVALDWGLRKTLGKEKGERVFGVINHWVCERANPFMQLVYLSLVIGGYAYLDVLLPYLLLTRRVAKVHLLASRATLQALIARIAIQATLRRVVHRLRAIPKCAANLLARSVGDA